MKERFAIYPLALCIFALVGEVSCANSSDSPVLVVEKEFNSCKLEYKNLVDRVNSELKALKEKASPDFPEIYKKKQIEITQKANECKKLKEVLEMERKLEAKAAPLRQTPPGEKLGPQFRCFQLGQNWSEFEACAKSLGYSPRFSESKTKEVVFAVNERVVKTELDGNGYIAKIQFAGGDFWGTSSFDNHFIQAFIDHYRITDLSVDQMFNTPGAMALGIMPMTYYKGNIQGGTIRIIPDLKDVLVEKTATNSGYKF